MSSWMRSRSSGPPAWTSARNSRPASSCSSGRRIGGSSCAKTRSGRSGIWRKRESRCGSTSSRCAALAESSDGNPSPLRSIFEPRLRQGRNPRIRAIRPALTHCRVAKLRTAGVGTYAVLDPVERRRYGHVEGLLGKYPGSRADPSSGSGGDRLRDLRSFFLVDDRSRGAVARPVRAVDDRGLPPSLRPPDLSGGQGRPALLSALRGRIGSGLRAALVRGPPGPSRPHGRGTGSAQHPEGLLVGALGLALLPGASAGRADGPRSGGGSPGPVSAPVLPAAGRAIRFRPP